MAEPRATAPVRGLPWVLAALGLAIAPHARYLPPWVLLLVLAIAAWRWTANLRGWPLPRQWLRALVVVAATIAVLGTYRTVNGLEAGTTFLVLMAGVKLLETR